MSFEIYQALNKEYRWKITSNNHKIVGASSEGFINRQDCVYNAELVRDALVAASK